MVGITNEAGQKGFTLVEIVISMAIFSIFMVGIIGSFAAIMKVHEHSIAIRDAQSNGRLVVEDISRLIRNAHKACISDTNANCAAGVTTGGILTIDSYTTFLLSGDQIIMKQLGQPDRTLTQDVKISNLSFTVPGVSTPYVRYSFNIDTKIATGVGPEWWVGTDSGGNRQGLLLGSTVSLRNGLAQ
jgi:prepilin-type N-terminal cleavage/methylation domain-containing protein